MSLRVHALFIHPVKSLGGIAVPHALTTDRGFQHDRRWMLVDADGRFLTQRELPAMACLHGALHTSGFRMRDVRSDEAIDLPWALEQGPTRRATVWDDAVDVIEAPVTFHRWISDRLQAPVRLAYMPDASHRQVDARYAQGITSLSDGFPYLILPDASLHDLNTRLAHAVPMDRFRPNIVIAGGEAFQEDAWGELHIGTCRFRVVKPCGRCVIVNTDQRTAERGLEPLRTLSTFRRRVNGDTVKVEFGVNAMAEAGHVVRVGDAVRVG